MISLSVVKLANCQSFLFYYKMIWEIAHFLRKIFEKQTKKGSCQPQCPSVLMDKSQGVHQLVNRNCQPLVEAARIQEKHLLSAFHTKLA